MKDIFYPTVPIKSVQFKVLENNELKKMSVIPNGVTKTDIYFDTESAENSILDNRLGTTNTEQKCGTCGLVNECPGHFGHINLPKAMYNIAFIDDVVKILNCICVHCSKLKISLTTIEKKKLMNMTSRTRFNEIYKLTSNIKECNRLNQGCGVIYPKIKKEIKKTQSFIIIVADYTIKSKAKKTEGDKVERETFTPTKIYSILKNVSNEDSLIMGFDPKFYRIENLILKLFPVAPIQVRPSIKLGLSSSTNHEDSLTIILVNIVKKNMSVIKSLEKEKLTNNLTMKELEDDLTLLQCYILSYFYNSGQSKIKLNINNKSLKSISEKIDGKNGRIRGNLMGKRVEFSARTVIGSDPNLSINEVGVPIKIAMNMTFPEVVTPDNIDKLIKLVSNGVDVYPGANFIIPKSSYGENKYIIDLKYRKIAVNLNYGDIVERHMQDGDYILFNRQPSLHKYSLMCHKAVIINDNSLNTFRLNVNVTDPYNADFDGDEMVLYMPQSIQTSSEIEYIASIKNNLISGRNCKLLYKTKQESPIGIYELLTSNKVIPENDYMNYLANLKNINNNFVKGNKPYTYNLFSELLPKNLNLKVKSGQNNILIDDGVLKEKNKLLNSKELNDEIIYNCVINNSADVGINVIDNIQKLAINYLLNYGFTISLKDCYLENRDNYKKAKEILYNVMYHVETMLTEVENFPNIHDVNIAEFEITSYLSNTADSKLKQLVNTFEEKKNDGLYIISNYGGKGNLTNYAAMLCGRGQHNTTEGRIESKVNDRVIVHYNKFDDTALAKGFIFNSFFDGLTSSEHYIHNVISRQTLIAAKFKSVSYDTDLIIQTKTMNNTIVKIGKFIDDLMIDGWFCNIHTPEQHFKNINKLGYKIFSTDQNGIITLNTISKITRHKPTDIMYKITTSSGREVVLTDCHSLLIYNNNKLIKTTPDKCLCGDLVPVSYIINSKYDSKYDKDNNFIILTEFFINKIYENKVIMLADINEIFNNALLYNYIIISLIHNVKYNINTINCQNKECAYKILFIMNLAGFVFEIIDFEDYVKLYQVHYYNTFKDVYLDSINSIEKITYEYDYVYDITVENTYNFSLANGLHVVDTADSGYEQRKMTKGMEDAVVSYDQSVRMSNKSIVQLVYGMSGFEQSQQKLNTLYSVNMSNNDIINNFKFTDKELEKITTFFNYTKVDVSFIQNYNDNLYKQIISLRDNVREMSRILNLQKIKNQFYQLISYKVLLNKYKTYNKKNIVSPVYIINKLIDLITNKDIYKMFPINSEIRYNDYIIHKQIFIYCLLENLNPVNIYRNFKITKNDIDEIVNTIIDTYNRYIISAGQMVGSESAQYIVEPLTQDTLKSYHKLSGFTETTQLARFKEIIAYTDNIKTPKMNIHFLPEYAVNKELIEYYNKKINKIVLKDLVNVFDIVNDVNPLRNNSYYTIDKINNSTLLYLSNISTDINDIQNLPWLFRMSISREKLYEKNINLIDIKTFFIKNLSYLFNTTRHEKIEKEIISNIKNLAIMTNSLNDDELFIHIRLSLENVNLQNLVNIRQYFLENIVLQGFSGYSMVSEKNMLLFDNEGNSLNKTEYFIEAMGIDFNTIFKLKGIDKSKTHCNDLHIIYEKFGIEATRNVIIEQLLSSVNSENENISHFILLADIMTFMGYVVSIGRNGFLKLDTDPLGRASFEMSTKQLSNAALYSEEDKLNSVSSRIMIGKCINGGTTLCEVKLDVDMLEKYETSQFKHQNILDNLLNDNQLLNIYKSKQYNGFKPN